MTTVPSRFVSAVIAGLCALPQIPVASAAQMAAADAPASPGPALPEVVRGSAGHERPAAARPSTATKCVPSPEAKLAATVASGLSGPYAGTRYVTGPMSMQGAAAFIAVVPSYGCTR
jgi:hypothetical protein